MVGLVVVSHSAALAHAVSEVAAAMGGDSVRIETAGGGPDGTLGADAASVERAIARADDGQGVLLLGDLGSSIISIKTALEARDADAARFADAPLVEGLVAAAVTASVGGSLAEVAKAAEEARHARKL